MVDNILTKKQNGVSLADAGVIAISKPVIEGAFNLLRVGNNNLISAAIKTVSAGVVSKTLPKNLGGNVATAMLVSAVDDVVTRFIPGLMGGKTAKNVQVIGGSDSNQSAQGGALI